MKQMKKQESQMQTLKDRTRWKDKNVLLSSSVLCSVFTGEDIFDEIDLDCSSEINLQELKAGLCSVLGV